MRQRQGKRARRLLLVSGLGLVMLVISAAAGLAANTPSMAFDSSSWDYAVVAPGATFSKTFVLTNGKGATGSLTVYIAGSSTFTKTADTCSGTRLATNKSCSVTVQFAPTAAGTHETGSLNAYSTKPLLNASVTLVGGVSEGCAAVNETAYFQGLYISGGVNLPFQAGETVTANSAAPNDPPTPTQVFLRDSTAVVAIAGWPGPVVYTIPAGGANSIGWGTDTNAVTTWTVSCSG